MMKACALLVGLCLVGLGLFAVETNEVKGVEQKVDAIRKEQGERMARLLKEANLNYELTQAGEFRVTFQTGKDRYQFVYLNPNPVRCENYKALYIYSVGYRGRLTKAMSMELLMSASVVGYYRVLPFERAAGVYEVLCVAQVPDDILASDLKSVCGLIASQADVLEGEWTDGDKY